MRRLALLAALLFSCVTVQDELGVPGGRTLRAEVATADGARIELRRWSPRAPGARRVLVVPPLGFDAAIVTPLCHSLRERGFDVATFSWRTPRSGTARGLAAAARDVESAYLTADSELVLLVGYGAVPALPVLRRHPPRGIVAVNVPVRMRLGNPALREAWSRDGYAPHEWARGTEAALLLGAGRVTPPAVAHRFATLAVPVDARTSRELTTLVLAETWLALPDVPLRVLVGSKDNLVQGEDALAGWGALSGAGAGARVGLTPAGGASGPQHEERPLPPLISPDETGRNERGRYRDAVTSTEPFSFPQPHRGNEKGGPATPVVTASEAAGRDEAARHSAARRLALADYFARDWGHLDWLVDPLAETDVWPVIAAELEALP